MSSQPPPKPPPTSNGLPLVPTSGASTQELSDRETLSRNVLLHLLQGTNWPDKSEDAAQKLVQTINNLPDLPRDVTPVKEAVEELIRVLGTAHASLKEASDRYGRKQGGFVDGVKRAIPSRRRGKWTDILRTCRADVEKLSMRLRNHLESLDPIGSVEDSEIPSVLQNQPPSTLVDASLSLGLLESQGLQTSSSGQAMTLEHPTGQQISVQDSAPDLPEDQENRTPIRDGALAAFKTAFKTIDAVSGTIPAVGSYVGAAAKVGLAFVNMIETMDKNEDVTKELASHTSKLSTYLERIKNKSGAEHGDDLAAHVNDLHRELESIQKKVSQWKSLGSFKKAFSASDYAEELKGHQDTVQAALEEMQLLVSLKTSDLVIELKNGKVRAERRRLLGCLGDGSYGARGSSIEDVVCLPGTRVEILNRIDQWIKDTSTSVERVLWIRGMAGRGKSTIAATVAHSWASRGSCAIFHFRRGQNASDGQFICALARQLGKGLVPAVKNAILGAVRENEDIAKERLDQQFKTLLVGSLAKLKDHAHPILIIVDALDECENVSEAVRFVRLIDQHSAFLPTHVKFLLTCRPEAPLIKALEPRKWHAEDLDSISHASEDIARFIEHSFAQIREDHDDLPQDWPSSADVEAIVKMSQGLFQWARTAITYIGDRSPSNRLLELLQHSSKWGKLDYLYRQILSKAFHEAAENSMRKQLLSWVLETLVVAPYPVSLEVVAFLHADHEIFKGQGDTVQFLRNDILADLNSLLHIPSSQYEPLRLMHTSIRDLLVTRERCNNQHYFVEPVQAHGRLASVSLRIMERDLRQNICELSDISKANSESEVQAAVESHVPKGLRYCCRSWSIHLTIGIPWSKTNGAPSSDVLSSFRMICENKLLAWLEVMSLIGATNEAFTIAKQVHVWLEQRPPGPSSSDLLTLWNDTQRFIASSLEPISFSALHIYASALPHCPVETKLWTRYGGQATTRILHGERQINWSANIWTSELDEEVSDIEFSPDGRVLECEVGRGTVQLLDAQTGASLTNDLTSHEYKLGRFPDGKVPASASEDNTIRLLDAQTGVQLGVLTGHMERIDFVVFSPDSKVLASVSDDNTVRLWDAGTGVQFGDPLTGHADRITFVEFSPDGKALASGSKDNTVRLWDALTGARLGDPLTSTTCSVFSPNGKVLACESYDKTVRLWDVGTGAQLGDVLTGHTEGIDSIVFSPDGKVLAFVSDDHTIRLWDAGTGVQLGDPLTGHAGWITTLSFSPDGRVLASGSEDNTVRLWDALTGAQLTDPLTGHTKEITSIVFSPDGKVLASTSHDDTIQLWDAGTGAQLADPLIGHADCITFVVFSPDGKVLASASASDDYTVRLWDARPDAQLDDSLTDHTNLMTSVVFSPDGEVLASMSEDNTIQLWNARTGAQLGGPLTGHTGSIESVVFSPDGKVLASASENQTVQLWDGRTGAKLGDPLTGHTGSIRSIVFSPDGKVLASASEDQTVRLWDGRTGAQLGEPLRGHTRSIVSVVFSPDGKTLASMSRFLTSEWPEVTVRLWDGRTGAQLGDPLTGHMGSINFIVFSPDGKILASAMGDNTICLWNARTGAQLGGPLTGHAHWITSVVFSPDGQVLVSASEDRKVRLWDGRTGARLGHPLRGHKGPIKSVFLSPLAGRTVLTSKSADGITYPLDLLTYKTSAGLSNIFIAYHPRFESSWILCGSKRLLWSPVHWRYPEDEYPPPEVHFSHGRLAWVYDGKLSIIDVSELLTL